MGRVAGFLVLFGACALTHASFELVLVADQAVGGTIHRFDGETGVWLGDFGFTGGFYGSASSMVVVQNRGECWVNEGPKIHRFNYNTGAYLGLFETSISMTSMSVSRDGNSVYIFNNTAAIRKFSASTLSLTNTLIAPSGNIFSGAESTSTSLIVQDTITSGQVNFRDLSLSTLTYANSFGFTSGASAMTSIPRVDLSGSFGATYDNISVITASSAVDVQFSHSLTNGQMGNYYSYPSSMGFSSTTLSAGAHQGFYLGGALTSGGNAIKRFSPVFSSMNTFGAGRLTNPFAMASVVAPEPTTMVALGFGALALIRRRRNKA